MPLALLWGRSSGQEEVKVGPCRLRPGRRPQTSHLTTCVQGRGFPESLQPQAPLPSQDARPFRPLAMAIVGHVGCQSHHHSHIETGPHGNGECGQEEGPAGGGAGQAEVPLGDGLAGLGRERC